MEEFNKIIRDAKGNISASRFNQKWFQNNGKESLWSLFESATSHMPESLTPYQKYRFYLEGYIETFPKCYCGNPCGFLDRKPSQYCSKQCALSSSSKSDKLKKWYESADKEAIHGRRKKTMLEKYGVEYNFQREEVKFSDKRCQLPENAKVLLDKDWLQEEYVNKKRTGSDIADQLGVYYGTVLYHCQKHGFEVRQHYNTSQAERDLADWIESLGVSISRNDRKVLDNFEVDIFIPEKNLGIEVNGLRYHSEWYREKDYHEKKWLEAKSKGIKLLQFTDRELKKQKDIVLSMIKASLGLNEKIPARKCLKSIVPKQEAEEFFEANHIQGYSPAYPTFGLRYQEEWVFMVSFGKPRFDKKHDYEIVRMASKRGVTVVGGFSKILKLFREVYPGKSIMSYVDPMKADGHSLLAVGFVEDSRSRPGYFWTDGDEVISRFKAQRKQLEKWLPSFDPEKTEVQNMKEAGFARYWDCGQMKFVLR